MQNFLIIFACVLKGFVNGFAFLIRMFLCPSYPCSLVLHFCQRNKISSFLGLKTNFSTIRQLLKLILKILCWCSLRVLSKFIKAIIVQVFCRHKHIKSESWQLSRKKQTNKQTKQYKKIVKLSYLHYLSEVCVSFIFLRASHFLSPWGWGEGFLGEHMARGGTRGGENQLSPKEYREGLQKINCRWGGRKGEDDENIRALWGNQVNFI